MSYTVNNAHLSPNGTTDRLTAASITDVRWLQHKEIVKYKQQIKARKAAEKEAEKALKKAEKAAAKEAKKAANGK